MFDDAPPGFPVSFWETEHFNIGELIENDVNDPLLWRSEDDILVVSLGGGGGGIAGYWKGADHEYMEVRFTADGSIYYGWIEISVSDTYDLATIHSWAYNTVPGEGLVAGVVPEPSTIVLFLIGISIFGVKRFKRYFKF